MKWIFSQFLSATVEPAVDRVSAPSTTPSWEGGRGVGRRVAARALRCARARRSPRGGPRRRRPRREIAARSAAAIREKPAPIRPRSPLTANTIPAMVVPVFFSRGGTTPRAARAALRAHRSNEKPGSCCWSAMAAGRVKEGRSFVSPLSLSSRRPSLNGPRPCAVARRGRRRAAGAPLPCGAPRRLALAAGGCCAPRGRRGVG